MAEITMEEIGKAISRLKANKAPGTDGFPAEWYKAFKDQIVPMLFDCFNYTLKKGEPPGTWSEAIILVIPKEGKDRKECSAYRPISVLNIDYKLYASILVKRLEHIIVELVDPDQTDFVRERQTQDNIRWVLHVIDHVIEGNIGATVISLDAEKAFDSVSWKYLYLALRRFGFNITMKLVSSYHLVDVERPMIAGNFATEMFHINSTTMLIIYHRYACWSMYLYLYLL